MYNWENQQAARLHNAHLQHEAEQARLAHEALNSKNAPNAALAALGRWLVEAGSRLQENYSDEQDAVLVKHQGA